MNILLQSLLALVFGWLLAAAEAKAIEPQGPQNRLVAIEFVASDEQRAEWYRHFVWPLQESGYVGEYFADQGRRGRTERYDGITVAALCQALPVLDSAAGESINCAALRRQFIGSSGYFPQADFVSFGGLRELMLAQGGLQINPPVIKRPVAQKPVTKPAVVASTAAEHELQALKAELAAAQAEIAALKAMHADDKVEIRVLTADIAALKKERAAVVAREDWLWQIAALGAQAEIAAVATSDQIPGRLAAVERVADQAASNSAAARHSVAAVGSEMRWHLVALYITLFMQFCFIVGLAACMYSLKSKLDQVKANTLTEEQRAACTS